MPTAVRDTALMSCLLVTVQLNFEGPQLYE